MSIFVESLKRIFSRQLIANELLERLLLEGKITQEEMDYIKTGA